MEAEVCQAHERIPVEILPKMSVSSFVGFLKWKNGLTIFDR